MPIPFSGAQRALAGLTAAVFGFSGFVGGPSAAASVSFNLSAGYIRGVSGVTINTNSLIMLVAAGGTNGTTFSNPVAGSYVTGGDVVLGAAALNAFHGTSTDTTGKETSNVISAAYPGSVTGGAYIELRWYPGITYAQYMAGTTPGGGMSLGEYNPLATNLSGDTTLNPDGGATWTLPGDGATVDLNFFTRDDANGSQDPMEGYARFVVDVPEASTLLGGALVVVAGGFRQSRRRGQARRRQGDCTG